MRSRLPSARLARRARLAHALLTQRARLAHALLTRHARLAHALLALTCLSSLAGCVNGDAVYYVVDLEIDVSVDADGPITLTAHHATQGEGLLEHPLGPFDEAVFEDDALISWQIAVPQHEGEGLIVYGWQDRDGDGVLCAPGVDDEPAGLTVVEAYPAHAIAIELVLDANCRGPEALVP